MLMMMMMMMMMIIIMIMMMIIIMVMMMMMSIPLGVTACHLPDDDDGANESDSIWPGHL